MKLSLLVETEDIPFDGIIVGFRDINISAERVCLDTERSLNDCSIRDEVVSYYSSGSEVENLDSRGFCLIVVCV